MSFECRDVRIIVRKTGIPLFFLNRKMFPLGNPSNVLDGALSGLNMGFLFMFFPR